MKVNIGLVLDYRMQNFASKLAFDISNRYNSGILINKFPQYIKIGPSIEIKKMDEFESYLDMIAESTQPFNVEVLDVDLMQVNNEISSAEIALNIKTNEDLIDLNNRINNELSKIQMLQERPENDYKAIIAKAVLTKGELKEVQKEIRIREMNYTFLAKEIALLCSSEDEAESDFTYKVIPLYGYKQYVCL